MIVFDRKEKEIKVPEGLGNINLTVVDANLEDKTVEINEVETTILPSSGYNGMSSLQIDAQPVYDNGYNEGENIGYNSGYTAGDADGYNRGYNEGETTQKAKLTGITITENGTYSREDGYNTVVVDVPDTNGSYDEGYDAGKVEGYDSGYTAGIDYASENAGEIAAANAIDLVATEIGTYYTKYSDNIDYPEVTGVFPNGENFYNYAYTDKIYDTGIAPNVNSEIELWFKPDGAGGTWGCIISAGYQDNNKYTIRIRRTAYDAVYIANFGEGMGNGTENGVTFNLNTDVFNHIKLSANGLYVNGVFYDGFEPGNFTPQGTFVIDGFTGNWATGETGYYGMIKITTDDVINVIVPTEDGFKNITTNTIIPQIYEDIGSRYEYIDSTPIVLDNLIKSVNVQPKIDVAKYGIKFAGSTFSEIPDFYDLSNITDAFNLFCDCANLKTIPLFDTSNVTTMQGMFGRCYSLIAIPQFATSKVTTMVEMLSDCTSLTTIPQLDTSNVTDMRNLFYKCTNLTTVPPLNAGKLSMSNYYGLFGYTALPNLTDFGGLIGLKYSLISDNNFPKLPNLTYQSCINILNGLYDFVSNGETPTSKQGQIKVHPNFLTTVGDEISIGTNKGWTITA